MFPSANSFYTYGNLVTALQSFPAFATTGSTTTRLQEAAAFFANVSHETSGLVYIREIQQSVYCSASTAYPCAAGQEYYGRGPMQISWNFNYGPAGAAIGQNLLANPDLVATNGVVTWQTALWYWMTQSGNSFETPHTAMTNGTPAFGETIESINGGIECGQASGSLGYQEMENRVSLYQQFTTLFGVSPGGGLTC
jgi:predicted chitinase